MPNVIIKNQSERNYYSMQYIFPVSPLNNLIKFQEKMIFWKLMLTDKKKEKRKEI